MKKILALFLVLFAFTFFLSRSVFASTFSSSDDVVLPADQALEGDYFAAGDKVTISGSVTGDVYVASGEVVLNGRINGDLLVLGGKISVEGVVLGNVRALGGEVLISGVVGKNVSAIGGNVALEREGKVLGSFTGAGGDIQIAGPVDHDLNLAAGEVEISNKVGGSAAIGSSNIKIDNNARIGGDVNYWSRRKVEVAPQASVSGRLIQNEPPDRSNWRINYHPYYGLGLVMKLLAFFGSLIVGFIFLKLFPHFFSKGCQLLRLKTLKVFGLGFLILILFPFVFVILVLTLVGIPFALMLGILLLIAALLGKIFVGLILGAKILKILKQKTGTFRAFTVGLVAYYLLTLVPIFGPLWAIAVCILGVGISFWQGKITLAEMKAKKIV